MSLNQQEQLKSIRTFPSLIKYLRDEMEWPIESSDFEELTFDFTPEELGIDAKNAANIQEIKRLRPLSTQQPWGIFFVKFEPKRLPVVALRRLLSQVTLKKRASANSIERAAWDAEDLLFVSNFGEGDNRQITFAHFSNNEASKGLPTLKVLGWDNLDTPLHLDHVAESLISNLAWQRDDEGEDLWRRRWRSAFSLEHREVITTSKRLAEELAKLARNIRTRINTVLAIETKDGPVSRLMSAFKEALIHDLDEDGFANMYAQTIAYGFLSARMVEPLGTFGNDLADSMPITNPFLKELMETFVSVGKKKTGKVATLDFDELGVSEVMALLDKSNMEAVIRDFGDKNPQEDPVIHFFEGFLQEYDNKIRKGLGVFYTPRPVVSFIVRSVDEQLRTEFGLEDGLADTTTWGEMTKRLEDLRIPEGVTPDQSFIQILDPATGTGTFLVEVIGLIHETMVEKWLAEGHGKGMLQELWNEYVPKHLLSRLYGFELMMAPYAIAHMKIGLKLHETGYKFASKERARVYLTNTLEPFRKELAVNLDVTALAHESRAVNEVKRDQRFTVVVGNPPYSKISSNLSPEMRATVERYRYVNGIRIKERGALQFEINLQDDYVKFFRFCERTISMSDVGVLGLITNNGYLSSPTLRGMRNSLLETFRPIRVLDIHGHLAKGETGPNGSKEENVFDIVQGVALFIGCRTPMRAASTSIFHAEQYGLCKEKFAFLQSNSLSTVNFSAIEPSGPYYLLLPHDAGLASEWRQYPGLQELFPKNSAGIITARDGLVIAADKKDLAKRLERFSIADSPESSIYSEFGFSESKRFNLQESQAKLRELKSFTEPIRRLLHRPFDERHIFFHRSVVWSLSRPMADQMNDGDNVALVATRQVTRPQFEHAFVTRSMIEIKACSHDRNTQIFPLFIKRSADEFSFSSGDAANLDQDLLEDLANRFGLELRADARNLGEDGELTPLRFFHFIYAILHCPSYRKRYFEFLRSDFPRIPEPENLVLFSALARLGGRLVGTHLLETPITNGRATSLAGPGGNQLERVSYTDGTIWIDKAKTRGFVGVPVEVWNFHIGGYQVCKKWLKDRQAKGGKNPRPGHVLTTEDVDHYKKMIMALSETIRIMDEIDEVVEKHGGWPGAFVTETDEASVEEST
jgi:predicted helicase